MSCVCVCGRREINSGPLVNTCSEINRRIVSEPMFKSVSDKAVTEEKEKNVGNGRTENHLKVSGDGSWKKRGYTSMLRVTTLVAHNTDKVIDLFVKSSFCQACTLQKRP